MLDFELANMYGVETAQLKKQVRRNIERFEGEDFMFEVTHEEILRCQNGTSSWGGSRYQTVATRCLPSGMESQGEQNTLLIMPRSWGNSQGNKDIKKAMNEEGIRWKLEMMLLCLY